jgi:hypothetical protein
MSLEERNTWIVLLSQVLTAVWYVARIAGKAATEPVSRIEYRGELLILVIASVGFVVVGTVIVASVTAGRAALRGESHSIDRTDERDRSINRFAGNIGGYVLGFGAVPALGLAVFEFDHFWIAQTLLAAFLVSELVTGAVKIAAYRRGF